MDIDNDHTNNPDEWITPAALVVRLVLLILRVAGVCVPAEREVPVMGSRRRLTPEYRRDGACLVLDTGSSIASVARD